MNMPKSLLSFVVAPVAFAAIMAGAPGLAADRAPESRAQILGATQTPVRYVVAPAGNEARYRVREQLANLPFPNDAVGVTQKVSGGIVIDANGQPVPTQSRILVDVSDLTTDQQMRDNFIRRNTLQTEQYPTVEVVPTSFRGLPAGPLPTSGRHTFELVANVKIRDVTRSVVWNVTADFAPGRVSGNADTRFLFSEFELTQPQVARVISVASAIGLEYDFNLVVQN
jgi:polyisoprenoid-binding protein YceI